MLQRSPRLLPIVFALGTLHCDDGVTIIQTPSPLRPGADPAAPPAGGGEGGGNAMDPGPGRGGAPTVEPGSPDDPTVTPAPGNAGSGGAPAPTGACQPRGAGGPFWLVEGGAIAIQVECGTGAALPGEAFELSSLPANTSFDAASRTLTFSPGLDQAGVYQLPVGVAGTDDVGHIEVQVADAFDTPGNVPVNPLTYTEELGLPVLHLTLDPGINDQEYLPASITYRGHSFEGAQAKYRGQTSLGYPKKSFTLKFTKEDRFGDPISVAGFAGKRKVTLTTTFDDNTNVRARLAFELWNRIGAEHVQVQAYNAVVYLNGEFWGMYTITDHVDEYLVEDYGLHEDGNLYKARTHDANFRLTRSDEAETPKLSLAEGFTKEEGTPAEGEPGASADLEALVSWVATSTPEQFVAELGSRLTQREYEDWWLLVSFVIAGDSAGKNSYHYRDPRPGAPDARFHVVPWDFNDSFGQTFYNDHAGREATRDPEELAEYNRLFERLLSEPLRGPLIARYLATLDAEWELSSILETFDAWVAENEPVAARDERKWGQSYAEYFSAARSSGITTHGEEIAYVRQWLIDRWTFVRDHY